MLYIMLQMPAQSFAILEGLESGFRTPKDHFYIVSCPRGPSPYTYTYSTRTCTVYTYSTRTEGTYCTRTCDFHIAPASCAREAHTGIMNPVVGLLTT